MSLSVESSKVPGCISYFFFFALFLRLSLSVQKDTWKYWKCFVPTPVPVCPKRYVEILEIYLHLDFNSKPEYHHLGGSLVQHHWVWSRKYC